MPKAPFPIDALPPFGEGGNLNVIVETPAGHRSKLKYDPQTGLFVLGRILPEGFVFPFDFGFVPGTLAEDGDPVDVLLIAETGTAPGCLVLARPLGVLEVEERKARKESRRNDRVLAVPLASRRYADLEDLRQIPRALREQLEYFLTSYNVLEGKEMHVIALEGVDRAAELVREAVRKK